MTFLPREAAAAAVIRAARTALCRTSPPHPAAAAPARPQGWQSRAPCAPGLPWAPRARRAEVCQALFAEANAQLWLLLLHFGRMGLQTICMNQLVAPVTNLCESLTFLLEPLKRMGRAGEEQGSPRLAAITWSPVFTPGTQIGAGLFDVR